MRYDAQHAQERQLPVLRSLQQQTACTLKISMKWTQQLKPHHHALHDAQQAQESQLPVLRSLQQQKMH
jgi:hypothetical protein